MVFSKTKLNVLLIAPSFSTKDGGIQNYCKTIKKKIDAKVESFSIGRLSRGEGVCLRGIRLFYKYIFFLVLVVCRRFDVIHINTSLDPKSLVRDGFLLLIAALFGRTCILVSFHGWQLSVAEKLTGLKRIIFRKVFFKANAIIVLAEEFRNKLREIGFHKKIYIESTFADDEIFAGINNQIISYKKDKKKDQFIILFLSRVIIKKGIFITLEAFRILQTKFNFVKLVVAGDGDELDAVKEYVRDKKLQHVEFTGFIDGYKKRDILLGADVFILPSYGEGMPISLIEAMLCGLPVVSRPVGGIKDFFVNGEMGFLIESLDPLEYAKSIEELILNEDLVDKIRLVNNSYALKRFMASAAADRLLLIYYDLLKNDSVKKSKIN
jgi:glycosyltransferase involved in cell wall biosynthesis